MTKMQRFDINCETGEQKLVDFTAEEIEQFEKDVLARNLQAEKGAEKQAIKDSALAKLAAIGLTADEIVAITG